MAGLTEWHIAHHFALRRLFADKWQTGFFAD
jgi:hypothetical protein